MYNAGKRYVTKDVNILHREMAYVRNHYVKGMPKFRAYREAGYMASTVSAAWQGARQIEKRKRVQDYIRKIQEELAVQAQQEVDNEFLTFEEKRKFLAKVVRTPVAKVDEHDALASEVKESPDGTKTIKMPDKLKAVELDSRLVGDFKDKVTVDVSEKVLSFIDQIDV